MEQKCLLGEVLTSRDRQCRNGSELEKVTIGSHPAPTAYRFCEIRRITSVIAMVVIMQSTDHINALYHIKCKSVPLLPSDWVTVRC